MFVVREPFQSKASGVMLTAGMLEPGEELRFESLMPEGGVIFSDGVEVDTLAFNSGCVATVRAADRRTKLVADVTLPRAVCGLAVGIAKPQAAEIVVSVP